MTDSGASLEAANEQNGSPVAGPSAETPMRKLEARPEDPRWFIQPGSELLLKLPSGNVKVLDKVRQKLVLRPVYQ
jgi:hypothetical protein